LEKIQGIGPSRAEALNRLGFNRVSDLVYSLPRKYVHRKSAIPLADVQPDELCTCFAKIVDSQVRWRGRNRGNLRIKVEDDSSYAILRFLKIPAGMIAGLTSRKEILFWGKGNIYRGELSFIHPEFDLSPDDHDETLIPIYEKQAEFSREGLGRKTRSKIALAACHKMGSIDDPIPRYILKEEHYPNLFDTILQLHDPTDWKTLSRCRERMAFQELLILQMVFRLRKLKAEKDRSIEPFEAGNKYSDVLENLPFNLTDGQVQVLGELINSFAKPGRSMELLSGDVGSGKTLVAMLIAVAAIESDKQAAIVVPSVLVAKQHADFLYRMLNRYGIEIGLHTGESSSPVLLERLADGNIDLVVGTQALLSDKISFKNLGLVIIDEQHRLGVRQRSKLPMEENAHVLLMTATPIPRTSAMAIYGDLNLHELHGFPSGRAGYRTFIRSSEKRPDIWKFIKEKIENGERAFIVHPKIEGDDFSSASFSQEQLENEFPGKTALLHGRMDFQVKQDIIDSFKDGGKPILVTTSVIEIGIDIPEATVMIIESAERFGLAQLHQLRGRIGRSSLQGFCILITDKNRNSSTYKRLKAFSETNDGFEISLIDLQNRREGEIFDFAQSGTPDFRFSDPLQMKILLEKAVSWSERIIMEDPDLENEENAYLREKLNEMYDFHQSIELAV